MVGLKINVRVANENERSLTVIKYKEVGYCLIPNMLDTSVESRNNSVTSSGGSNKNKISVASAYK